MKITSIKARQILDSRGVPTVEADVWLESGIFGRAAVPSGSSTGSHEAYELRDGGSAFGGKGVLRAIANIEGEIADCLHNVPADNQILIDQKMIDLDGTQNKSRLGANAILAVSLACAHAAANTRQIPLYLHVNDIAGSPPKSLPLPMMNFLNGGKHATNSSDFQEFMVIPRQAESYAQAIQVGAEIFQALKSEIASVGVSTAVGDEGGFTFPVKSNTEMLDLLGRATEAAGYKPGADVGYGLDAAASELYKDGTYYLKTEGRRLNNTEMIDYLTTISQSYPMLSIEDGLDQDEWGAWEDLTKRLGELQLVGDDLLVTNPDRLQQAIDRRAGNAILIKPNQIGTLTETIHTLRLAKSRGWRTIISHRSGETEDVTIAHLAIGTGADQIKTGSLSRGERTAKHNEIMRIESADETLRLANPFKMG
ncbi:MAG: phosphopyruvate hydratase [Candidatus Saccharimonadales bacterium]|jgi:enolase